MKLQSDYSVPFQYPKNQIFFNAIYKRLESFSLKRLLLLLPQRWNSTVYCFYTSESLLSAETGKNAILHI